MTSELFDPFSISQFLKWEQASRDTIDVKRIYIDLAGDIITGLLLSQIIYWFLPSNGESKLQVEHEGRMWLAKLRTDWWDECRITPKQFDRSIQILKGKGLVETKAWMFNAFRTTHIWLNIPALVEGVSSVTRLSNTALSERERPLFTKGKDRSLPKGKTALYQRGRPITESTNIDYNIEQEVVVDEVYGELCTFFEENIHILTPYIGEQLKSALEEYPMAWIKDAIKIAADQNKRRWAYMQGILKRWKEEGRNAKSKPVLPELSDE